MHFDRPAHPKFQELSEQEGMSAAGSDIVEAGRRDKEGQKKSGQNKSDGANSQTTPGESDLT